jgi:fatty-acyl-CoA synthase
MTPPFRGVPVGNLLSWLAQSLPDNEALVYRDRGLRFTFAGLERESRLIARGLLALGIERGERVAVWATNVPEWIILNFALAKIGAILVTANTSLRAREIDYLLRQSESSTLITIPGFKNVDYIDELRQIGALTPGSLPALNRVILIGDENVDGTTPYSVLHDRAREVCEAELDQRERGVGVDDVINMQYTSGTTGFPKGVMLSSRNIVDNGYWVGEGLALTPNDRLCLSVPLFHCFGCVIGVLGAFTHGACLCALETFDALRVLETVGWERCTALLGVPTMFLAELEHPEFHKFDLSSLRTGVMAGSLCPESLMRRVIDEMHLTELTIVYGLTESSPCITQTHRNDSLVRRTQTVGTVMPEQEVKIIDPETGEEMDPGAAGELCVRGYNVMKGYYRDPDATSRAVGESGWLRSGDQATIDSDGYVRITGRIKDLIIRGGENIAPREVEDVLREHPAVADVSVYAVADRQFGEEVAAAVRLRPGETASRESLREFCETRLSRFKIPRYFRFVEGFPLTASGKVQKFKLREMHELQLSHETAPVPFCG